MNVPAEHFERLYQQRLNPYLLDAPFEQRRYARALACLAQHGDIDDALEIGCGEGHLSSLLAPHCRRLLAMDASTTALDRARTRLAAHPHVTLAHAVAPDDVPHGSWDLVVLAEIGYYLTPSSLIRLITRVVSDLRPHGLVLATHWRHPGKVFQQSGDRVHEALTAHPLLWQRCSDVDDDVRVECWTRLAS